MKRIFTFSTALLIWFSVSGQNPHTGSCFITNFTQEDIDAGLENFTAIQNSKGQMFFGNGMGVISFDGLVWELIPVSNKSYVRSLAVSEDDVIYVGAYQEFGFLEPDQNGHLKYTSLNDLIPDANRNFADIWNIHILNGKVYFQSYKKIFVYDGSKIDILLPDSEFVFSYLVGNNLYIQDRREGFLKLINNSFVTVPGCSQLKSDEIECVLPLDENQLLIGTKNMGLHVLKEGDLRPWNRILNKRLAGSRLNCGVQIDNQRLAFGTIQSGIVICDRKGHIIDKITRDNNLQDNLVRKLYVDFDKNLWVMSSQGIDYAEVSSAYRILASGIGSGYASLLFKDNLYLGTNQGLYYLPGAGVKDQNIEKPILIPNTVGQVWSICNIQGHLLLGHHEGAFEIKDNKAIKISNINGFWQFIELNNHPGYVISGTYTGFVLFKIMKDKLHFVRKLQGFDESCRVSYQDKYGAIWMSHGYKGIYQLQLRDDLSGFDQINFYNDKNQLPSELYNDIFPYNGEVYITTYEDGIYSFNQQTKRLEKNPVFTNYFSNAFPLTKVIVGPDNTLCNFSEGKAGLLTFLNDTMFINDFQTLAFVADKMVSPFESISWDNNNNMIIGTKSGFVFFSNTKHANPGNKFSINISDFQAIGGENTISYGGLVFSRDSSGFPIEIPYKNNLLRVKISANSFCNIGSNLFRYKISGLSEDWTNWSPNNQIELIKLKEGDYRLNIESKNFKGEMASPAQIQFTILPPWYRSWYAYIFYMLTVLLILGGIILFIKKRTERIKRDIEVQQLKKLEEQKLRLAAEKEKAEKDLIALKNAKLANEVIHKSKELANTTQGIIHKNQVLNNIKHDLKLMSVESKSAFVQRKIKTLIKTIDKNIEDDHSHDVFWDNFDRVHENFVTKIRKKHPDLSPKELRLCSYLRMNLTTKEIAPMLNISIRGVEISRYRLRKKLKLDRDNNLTEYILNL